MRFRDRFVIVRDWFQCLDCKYEWKTRKWRGGPARCPRCNSKNLFNLSKKARVEAKRKRRWKRRKKIWRNRKDWLQEILGNLWEGSRLQDRLRSLWAKTEAQRRSIGENYSLFFMFFYRSDQGIKGAIKNAHTLVGALIYVYLLSSYVLNPAQYSYAGDQLSVAYRFLVWYPSVVLYATPVFQKYFIERKAIMKYNHRQTQFKEAFIYISLVSGLAFIYYPVLFFALLLRRLDLVGGILRFRPSKNLKQDKRELLLNVLKGMSLEEAEKNLKKLKVKKKKEEDEEE